MNAIDGYFRHSISMYRNFRGQVTEAMFYLK